MGDRPSQGFGPGESRKRRRSDSPNRGRHLSPSISNPERDSNQPRTNREGAETTDHYSTTDEPPPKRQKASGQSMTEAGPSRITLDSLETAQAALQTMKERGLIKSPKISTTHEVTVLEEAEPSDVVRNPSDSSTHHEAGSSDQQEMTTSMRSTLPSESSRGVTAPETARSGNNAGSSSGFTQIDREPQITRNAEPTHGLQDAEPQEYTSHHIPDSKSHHELAGLQSRPEEGLPEEQQWTEYNTDPSKLLNYMISSQSYIDDLVSSEAFTSYPETFSTVEARETQELSPGQTTPGGTISQREIRSIVQGDHQPNQTDYSWEPDPPEKLQISGGDYSLDNKIPGIDMDCLIHSILRASNPNLETDYIIEKCKEVRNYLYSRELIKHSEMFEQYHGVKAIDYLREKNILNGRAVRLYTYSQQTKTGITDFDYAKATNNYEGQDPIRIFLSNRDQHYSAILPQPIQENSSLDPEPQAWTPARIEKWISPEKLSIPTEPFDVAQRDHLPTSTQLPSDLLYKEALKKLPHPKDQYIFFQKIEELYEKVDGNSSRIEKAIEHITQKLNPIQDQESRRTELALNNNHIKKAINDIDQNLKRIRDQKSKRTDNERSHIIALTGLRDHLDDLHKFQEDPAKPTKTHKEIEEFIQSHKNKQQDIYHNLKKIWQEVHNIASTQTKDETKLALTGLRNHLKDLPKIREDPMKAVRKYEEIEQFIQSYRDTKQNIYRNLRKIWQDAHNTPFTKEKRYKIQTDRMKEQGSDGYTPVERAIDFINEVPIEGEEQEAPQRHLDFLKALNTLQDELNIQQALSQVKEHADKPENHDIRPAWQEIHSMSSAERVLDNMGYTVIDKNPNAFPREIIIKPWRDNAEPLTGRPSSYNKAANKDNDLKELKMLTRELITKQAINNLRVDLSNVLVLGYNEKSIDGAEHQAEPNDWKKVCQGITHFIETGEKPRDFPYNKIEFYLPEIDKKIKSLGIIRREPKQGDSPTIYATSECTQLWEHLTGLDLKKDTRVNDDKILNSATISSILNGSRKSTIEHKKENDGSYKDIAKLFRIEDSSIKGEIYLLLDYRPLFSQNNIYTLLSSRNKFSIWGYDNTLYITDMQGQLSKHLGIGNSKLSDTRNANHTKPLEGLTMYL